MEASILDMQAAMGDGRTTSRQIVTHYLTRIGFYEDTLNVAVAINPNALAQADALDRERAAGRVLALATTRQPRRDPADVQATSSLGANWRGSGPPTPSP